MPLKALRPQVSLQLPGALSNFHLASLLIFTPRKAGLF